MNDGDYLVVMVYDNQYLISYLRMPTLEFKPPQVNQLKMANNLLNST
jgi:hypothetical protein